MFTGNNPKRSQQKAKTARQIEQENEQRTAINAETIQFTPKAISSSRRLSCLAVDWIFPYLPLSLFLKMWIDWWRSPGTRLGSIARIMRFLHRLTAYMSQGRIFLARVHNRPSALRLPRSSLQPPLEPNKWIKAGIFHISMMSLASRAAAKSSWASTICSDLTDRW